MVEDKEKKGELNFHFTACAQRAVTLHIVGLRYSMQSHSRMQMQSKQDSAAMLQGGQAV